MPSLEHLFELNRKWAADITSREPDFFTKLAQQQSPEYMWIGCSDSRVPANQIVGLMPGEIFVHRNVANVVVHTDLNCLSVMQFAVDVLKVKHILVVGHYGCGGVQAALQCRRLGLIDNWLRHVQDVRLKHASLIDAIPDTTTQINRLCELNVIEQVTNAAQTTVVQEAWHRGQQLAIHGWIYSLNDGIARDLQISVSGAEELLSAHKRAISALH